MKSYHDIAGDGGSRVVEQVEAQRARIDQNLAGVRHRVAIGSGKGGVGKSTLTLLLARSVARRGRRVAIFDADLNGPSQARLAGLSAAPLLPGRRGVALARDRDGVGVVSLGSVVPEGRALDFDSVEKGSSYLWRATREFTAVGELLGSVEWGRLDYLLFDLPPGAERTQQFADYLGPETAFVLVSTPAGLSRAVVSRSLAALETTSNPVLGYVENMSGYYCADCRAVKPLFPQDRQVELSLPCLGRVPFDPSLAAACDRGEAADEEADRPTLAAVHAVADRIIREVEADR